MFMVLVVKVSGGSKLSSVFFERAEVDGAVGLDAVYGGDKGAYMFKFVDGWRNVLIHGERFWSTMNAAIINLVTLILLHEVPYDKYLRAGESMLGNVGFWSSGGVGTPWMFYPPKLY